MVALVVAAIVIVYLGVGVVVTALVVRYSDYLDDDEVGVGLCVIAWPFIALIALAGQFGHLIAGTVRAIARREG